MPSQSPSRASEFINPADGLSFSGAISSQQQALTLQSIQAPLQGSTTSEVLNQIETTTESTDDESEAESESNAADLASTGSDAMRIESEDALEGLLTPSRSESTTSSTSADDATEDEDEDERDENVGVPSDCDTSQSDKYCVYTIQEGDLLSSIADRYGLTSTENFVNWELLVHSNNSVVVDPDDVSPGLKLIIPRGNGTIHTVRPAQTLSDIANVFDVSVEEIMSSSVNGISDPDAVRVGDEIFIPNPKRFAPVSIVEEAPDTSASDDADDISITEESVDTGSADTASADTASTDTSSSTSESTDTGAGDSGSGGSSTPAPSSGGGGVASGTGFVWPVSGPISSYFGPRHPLGIDIDLFNNRGAAILAAKGGVVTFAGGNSCCSYGYYVVVDHGDGFQTLYAHLSSIGVSVGESVGQGQYLGTSGTTGYSTGEHLHFEVHRNGSVVDPMNYLP